MPQRFLRPGITTSDAWNSVSFGAQSFYIRILTLVDDYGRYDGRIAILHAHCFALSPKIKPQDSAGFRSELQSSGLLTLYSFDGKEFIQLAKWNERARGLSKYPEPPQESAALSCAPLPNPASLAIALSHKPSPFVDTDAQKKFIKPTMVEIHQHGEKIKLSEFEQQKFWNYYESNGWRVGKNPMKSWPHALSNWKSNTKSFSPQAAVKPLGYIRDAS